MRTQKKIRFLSGIQTWYSVTSLHANWGKLSRRAVITTAYRCDIIHAGCCQGRPGSRGMMGNWMKAIHFYLGSVMAKEIIYYSWSIRVWRLSVGGDIEEFIKIHRMNVTETLQDLPKIMEKFRTTQIQGILDVLRSEEITPHRRKIKRIFTLICQLSFF